MRSIKNKVCVVTGAARSIGLAIAERYALDVFDKEPPGKDYCVVQLNNVTLTPHMAGGSNDAFFNSPKKLAAEMIKLFEGKDSRFIVNKKSFDSIAKHFLIGNIK